MTTWATPATSSRWVRIFKRRLGAGELVFLAAVVAAAAAFRLRSIGWGLPELSEEATPFRKALGMWGVDTGRLTLDPHFFNYPSLTFYFHFLLQGIWWFGGLLTGAWHSLDQFRTALATHP